MAGRVTQDVIEVPIETSSQSARVTQDVVEVPIETSSQLARVTQNVVEVPIETSNQLARVTQVVIEVLIQNFMFLPPTDCAAVFVCELACMELTWVDNATTETAYEVQASIDGGLNWTVVVDDLPPGTESYSDCDLEEGVWYQYRIRAVQDSYYSTWCVTAAVYSPPFWTPTTWPPIVAGPRFNG